MPNRINNNITKTQPTENGIAMNNDVVGSITAAKERIALVICDLQPDLLGSLQNQTDRLLLALEIIVEIATWSPISVKV